MKESGIQLSQTVLLGIGGTEMSREHAVDTGKLLGEMSPDFASALTVMLLPNTELYKDYQAGTFRLPDKFGLLEELKLIVENMDVTGPCLFTSNHASNYLPLRAVLPEQKAEILALLDRVLKSKGRAAPEAGTHAGAVNRRNVYDRRKHHGYINGRRDPLHKRRAQGQSRARTSRSSSKRRPRSSTWTRSRRNFW